MIKSLPKQSKPCMWGHCIVIKSESGPKQCQSTMNNSQNSASLRSRIFASLSNREKYQNPTKPQDFAPMKISEATPNQYMTLILMAVGRQKIGKNFGTPPQEGHQRTLDKRFPQGSQRGGALNHDRGHDRGPYTLKPPYCMYHGSTTNHRTKDCPISLEMKKKME
jgi:hypothetical protein